jgi:hypothetical protein
MQTFVLSSEVVNNVKALLEDEIPAAFDSCSIDSPSINKSGAFFTASLCPIIYNFSK